jgi:hypothetical protein
MLESVHNKQQHQHEFHTTVQLVHRIGVYHKGRKIIKEFATYFLIFYRTQCILVVSKTCVEVSSKQAEVVYL